MYSKKIMENKSYLPTLIFLACNPKHIFFGPMYNKTILINSNIRYLQLTYFFLSQNQNYLGTCIS